LPVRSPFTGTRCRPLTAPLDECGKRIDQEKPAPYRHKRELSLVRRQSSEFPFILYSKHYGRITAALKGHKKSRRSARLLVREMIIVRHILLQVNETVRNACFPCMVITFLRVPIAVGSDSCCDIRFPIRVSPFSFESRCCRV
jgi:hypothetical protein